MPSAARTADHPRPKILVVDDEPVVQQFITRALNQLGYETIAASDGRQARDLFDQHAWELALIWVELALPRMNGAQFIHTLPTLAPRIPVVFTSDQVGLAASEALPGPLLKKPFGAPPTAPYFIARLGFTIEVALANIAPRLFGSQGSLEAG